ncbi:MAG: hypothetical protein QXO39_06320 [Conexivisphaerales archaeon]
MVSVVKRCLVLERLNTKKGNMILGFLEFREELQDIKFERLGLETATMTFMSSYNIYEDKVLKAIKP